MIIEDRKWRLRLVFEVVVSENRKFSLLGRKSSTISELRGFKSVLMKLSFCEITATRGQFFGYITGITAKREPKGFFSEFNQCFFLKF